MRLDIESPVSSPVAVSFDTDSTVDTSRLLKQGVSAAQGGDRPLARTLLSSVTDANPQCVDAWLWLASISEYPEELLVFLRKVLDIEPTNERALTWEAATRSLLAKTLVQRGVIANEEGKADFAMQCFDEALGYDDRCDSAWFGKASLTKNEDEKLGLLARVLELDPDHADAKEAVAASKDARASEKMIQAKIAAAAGELETASSMLAEIQAADPSNCEAWVLQVHVANSLDEKFNAYEHILELDPNNTFARYGRDFLSELAETVRPVEEDPVEESRSDEQFEESDAMQFDEAPSDEHDAAPIEESAVVETVEQSTWSEPFEDDAPAQFATDETPANDPWSSPATEDIYSDGVHLDNPQDEDPAKAEVADSEPEPPAAQPEMAFADDYEADLAQRDTAEAIDPFEAPAEENAPLSMVAEEAAREAEEYASPTAETMEFRSDEHEFEEIVADEDPSELIDVTDAPSFDNESVSFAPPSPWESPSNNEPANHFEPAAEPEPVFEPEAAHESHTCPYCGTEVERQAFSCVGCNAVLSLSDLESLLANNSLNFDAVQSSVARMEAEWNSREFNSEELKTLGVGQFNLKNFDLGFAYIQEAYRKEPNDVILAGQVNALAIRLDEIRRQSEIKDAMPKGKTILVVDDSATVRKLISSKLEKSGHQVICAVDGVEAMATIETMVPDLVLLDIAMPRMDGYQVCKLIRANDAAKDVPVVMISGKDGFFDKVRGRMAGTTGYITKPFGPETLMKALETYLIPDTAAAE